MNPDASPGCPWSSLAKTNGEILDGYRDVIVEAVLYRLRTMCSTPYTDSADPEFLVRKGLCDPIKLFVKNEPHTQEKLDTGRVRLICSVSLVDQIIERLLFSPQNKVEIAHWDECPSKPGMGFSESQTDALFTQVETLVNETGCYPRCSDMSGWDWSVTEEDYEFDRDFRLSQCDDPDPTFRLVVFWRFLCLSRSVLMFSDGRLIAQVPGFYGIMKSGSFNTSSSNSRIRVAQARLAGAKAAFAMGDDCVEFHSDFDPRAVQSRYADSGKKLKSFSGWEDIKGNIQLGPIEDRPDVTPTEHEYACRLLHQLGWRCPQGTGEFLFEFCSHAYIYYRPDRGGSPAARGRVVSIYLNWRKSLVNLARHKVDRLSHLVEFVGLMQYNMWMPYCVVALLRCNWVPTSEIYFVSIPVYLTPYLLVTPRYTRWRLICHDDAEARTTLAQLLEEEDEI